MIDLAAGAVLSYALDDGLAEATAADGMPRVRIYRPDRVAVVLGRGSRAETELHLDAIRADEVPLFRRPGGGCAVVLDPGNVVVVAAIPQRGLPRVRQLFASLSAWLLEGLDRAGVHDVHREDVSDLALGDRKIGGASIYRPRDVALYGTTLLVEPDVARMERYLAHPPREPAWRRGRRHADFVGRLADLPEHWTAERLAEALQQTLRPPTLVPEGGPS
jgi:lipoate-protein ligase A